MNEIHTKMTLRALPILLGIGAAGLAVAAGPSASVADPVHCEIQADSSNGMIVLSGAVAADSLISGTYRLTVTGPAANISQGGAFTAAPGRTASLGNVMLNINGSGYDAHLELRADGMTVTCADRVGGAI